MKGSYWTTFGFLLLVGSAAVLAYFPHAGVASTHIAIGVYLAELAGVAAIVVGLGVTVTKKPGGFALNGQYAYSLTKTQMAGWSVVVIASLFTAAEIRIFGYFDRAPDPLNIKIPGELLAAMGIAVFTTAATPALLSLKTGQSPTDDQADAAAQRMASAHNTTKDSFNNTGSLVTRQDATLASWGDLISGEEVGNAGTVDLSKVQQLLVTLLLLGTYVTMMIKLIVDKGAATADEIDYKNFGSLPALSQSFVGLMAISHAGYLGYKAIPKPASENSTQPSPAAPPPNGIVAPQAAPPRP